MLTGLLERWSTTPSAGQRRAIAVNLVVFLAFALVAVVMLTRTALAANAINRDVASSIEPSLDSINEETRELPVLDVTARRTDRIADAAEPLTRHLEGVVRATDRIDENLAATHERVTGIGTSVDEIKQSTGEIRPAVGVLDGHVDDIHGSAGGIATSLSTVAGLSTSMVRGLTGTNASLARILSATAPLRAAVRGIEGTVPEIRGHARRISDSPILLRNPLNVTALLGNVLGRS